VSDQAWIALLGRPDIPVDGVEDYCTFLGQALAPHGVTLSKVRVPWAEQGWLPTLWALWNQSADWRREWVLLQYTAMAWSRRGFPFGAVASAVVLRRQGVQCAVVFHESQGQTGKGWIGHFRGRCQEWVIRRLYSAATKAIFPDPLERIGWLPKVAPKAASIPIGANLPDPPWRAEPAQYRNGNLRTIAVFCLSDPPNREIELGDIAHAMRFVTQHGLKARAVFLGRATAEAKEEIERLFDSTVGETVNLGLQSAQEVSRALSAADVMLCVRGPLFPTRGSAIAGIACGLPIVGYAGAADNTPLQEAGLELVPYRDREALGRALVRVLEDPRVQSELRARSVAAQRRHFSWDVIASKMVDELGCPVTRKE
jgi:hypothetical protein